MLKKILNIPQLIFIWIIKFYQFFISPILGSNCRFLPTCSDYTLQAIKKYGAIYGIYLGVKRILRCNILFKGGIDELK